MAILYDFYLIFLWYFLVFFRFSIIFIFSDWFAWFTPSQAVRYHVKARRVKHTANLMAELKKCGILCPKCHLAYDGVKKWKWPKKPWHDKYTKEGAKGANWESWKLTHLEASEQCDVMISDILAWSSHGFVLTLPAGFVLSFRVVFSLLEIFELLRLAAGRWSGQKRRRFRIFSHFFLSGHYVSSYHPLFFYCFLTLHDSAAQGWEGVRKKFFFEEQTIPSDSCMLYFGG